VLGLRPDHHDAIVALGELLAGRREPGDAEEALALIGRVPETAETRRVAALARTGDDVGDDNISGKLDALLDRVKGDDEARQEFVDLLEVLGPSDPRTAQYRRQLTARLF
jgi:putative thioredoxin